MNTSVNDPTIRALIAKKSELLHEASKLDKVIQVLRSVCEHEWWACTGDSHKRDHYRCHKCGAQR